ncbi:restriction endonuclease subunit S [Microbispora maris]|uniref:restriction endonuclease subunit S n=1 Tax=Microbispora maris TaxID=3144104 RepID=UPI003D15BDF2
MRDIDRWPVCPLGEIFSISSVAVNPALRPDTVFTHYSLPAFDSHAGPVAQAGRDIESQKFLVGAPSVLVSKLNPRIPRVQIAEHPRGDGCDVASTEFMVYVPKSNVDVDLRFYKRLFSSGDFSGKLQACAIGTTGSHTRVRPRETLGWKVPYPPLDEQGRIAEILDALDSRIEDARRAEVKLGKVEVALISELLSSVTSFDRLGLVVERVIDGVHHTPAYVESGVPFLTVENLTRGPGISFTPCRYISTSDHRSFIKRVAPRPGDVLVSKDGTLGVARVVPRGAPEFSIFVSVALLRPRMGRVTSDFLALFFDSSIFRRQLAALSSGSGLKHIHLHEMKSFRLPLPPLPDQEQIVARIRDARAVRRAGVEELSKLKLIREGLTQDLMTGRVRVSEAEAVLENL